MPGASRAAFLCGTRALRQSCTPRKYRDPSARRPGCGPGRARAGRVCTAADRGTYSSAGSVPYTRCIVRVLMVEDDATIADFVSKGLAEAGHAVDVARDGEQGVELALKGGYDAAIVDVMLPRLDGLALIDRIRARGVGTPVLILSADAIDQRQAVETR